MEDSGFYVIIINVDYRSNPGTSEMSLLSYVTFSTPFQGLYFYNMSVELNDTKGHFSALKFYGSMTLNYYKDFQIADWLFKGLSGLFSLS